MLESLGPYQFENVLGRGGMGTVFRGVHETTGQVHAVKVLAPQYADDEHFRGRFESEIKAMMTLDHPNIVRLLSYGQDDGNLFFAMELVKGKSLYDMQRSGHKFTWSECLQIAMDTCRGLKHAHDRGIIHRDLKPGNLLMTEEGVVKITDFGIAKTYAASHHTGTNILGTMDFMAPEQAKGETVTARSDIYSLGAVLFTLMSGKPPFSSNSMEEAFRNLTRVPVPKISTKVANVPPEVESLLAAMMEKKAEKRIATALATQHKIFAIFESLKEESEAKTSIGATPNIGKVDIEDLGKPVTQSSDDIIEISPPAGDEQQKNGLPATQLHLDGSKTIPSKNALTSPPAVSDADHGKSKSKTVSQPPVKSHKPKASRTRKNTVRKRKGKKVVDPGEDYFTPVTPEHRAALQIDSDSEQRPTAKWPLVCLLIICVGAAVAGTWFATKNPSADELYATIERSANFPEEIVKETENFMRLYKSDERFAEVELLNEVGHSIADYSSLVKRLSVRARIPGDSRLTEIEDQFMKIIELGNSDPKKADAKMEAFINVHSKLGGLSTRDLECVKAAEGFRIKIVGAEDRQVETHVRSINSSVIKAENLSPQEAKKLYASLIKLYIDDDWGQRNTERIELLKKIKDLYDSAVKLESEAPPESEETSESAVDEQPAAVE